MKHPCLKLYFAPLFFTFLIIFLNPLNGQSLREVKINLFLKDATFQEAIRAIEKTTPFRFFYRTEEIAGLQHLNLDSKQAGVDSVLQNLLQGAGFSFKQMGRNILIQKLTTNTPPQAQQTLIRGKIADHKGEPLAGATLRLRGSGAVAIADKEGNFRLPMPTKNDVLLASYVGYKPMEKVITIGEENVVTLLLEPEANTLEEVVVNTGYQTLPKERSAGSFSKPEMKVFAQRSTSMNVLQRLDGLVAGLALNAGATNGDFFPVSIRGISTIYGASQPLYVVDGVAVADLSVVNPNDVADVTVLKDATAASIWGARAANGVIVVTTKKGTGSDSRIKVDYDVFYNFQGKPGIDVFPTMNSTQYIATMKELYAMPGYVRDGATDWATISAPNITSGQNQILPHEYLLYGQEAPLGYEGKTLDDLAAVDNVGQMKDLWYRNALLSNHTLSLTANSGNYGAYASLAYTGQKDATPGDKNKLYQLNARQDYTFNKRIKAYLISNILYQELGAKRSIAPTSQFVPYAAFQDADGNSLDHSWLYWSDALRKSYEQSSKGLTDIGQLSLRYNPQTNFDSGFDDGTVLNSRILSGLTVHIWEGLRFEGVYGADLANNQNKSYDAVWGFDGQVELGKTTVTSPTLQSYLPTTGGTMEKTNVQQRNWTIRNQLAFDHDWQAGRHQLSVLLGNEYQKQTLSNTVTKVRGYDDNLLTYKPANYNTLSSGLAGTIINTNATYRLNDQYDEVYNDVRFRSWYANAAYTWQQRYTLNASTRFDESNLFGKDVSAQDKPVWSVGGSWLLSGEQFMQSASWLNRLQVRTTYGITGNSPTPGSGGSYDILAPGFAFGVPAGSVNAIYIATPGNSKLSWEETKVLNVGLDWSVLQNRLQGSLDFYHKHTTGLLGALPQSAFTGYPEVFGNAGVIDNNGLELTLQSTNIRNNSFSWSTQFNIAWNKGKVVKLNRSDPLIYASSIIKGASALYFDPANLGLVEGQQPFSLYAYRYAGLDAQGDPQIYQGDGSVTKLPGVAKVEDLVNMGSSTPLTRGGLSNFFSYKHLSLDVNLVYSLGFVIRRDVNQFFTGRVTAANYTSGNLNTEFLDRWKQPGDEANTNIPGYDPAADRASRTDLNYYTAADINVVKGDFVKLRDVSLSYALPEQVVRPLKISGVSFRLQMNNVMLWRANKYGIDPEFYNGMGARGSTYVTGIRAVPLNQGSITVGAHVTF